MTRKVCRAALVPAVLAAAIIFSCTDEGSEGFIINWLKPGKHFSDAPPPSAPDYKNPGHWGCLPGRDGDPCDEVPENAGIEDAQAAAKVDCFCVYPTTFFRRYGWNARLDDPITKRMTDKGPLRTQFSVFNGSARVFAPYYRQAQLCAFTAPTGDPDQVASLELATRDVINAFQYYLDHYDQGYPIIIAGHSQGVRHAINVLKKYFDGGELKGRLVAAYLIGGNLTRKSFEHLEVCRSPEQVGCVLGWRTMGWGDYTNEPKDTCIDCEDKGMNIVCVNPLSWRQDEQWVEASKNLGGVPSGFDKVDPGVTGAKCSGSSLWVKPTGAKGYRSLKNNYHICDYSLFYMNIRANVAERAAAFNAKMR